MTLSMRGLVGGALAEAGGDAGDFFAGNRLPLFRAVIQRMRILRIPHSSFRIPHSAFRIPHSAFRIPHSRLTCPQRTPDAARSRSHRGHVSQGARMGCVEGLSSLA